VEGRPLFVDVFGAGPPTTLVIGGIHGDEPSGIEIARRLAEFLEQNPQAARGRAVAVLVAANPDGAARHTRANANGADLNRNFPAHNWRAGTNARAGYGGPAPASEPETQALIRAIEILRPDRIFSLHSTAGGRPCNNYDGPAAGLARLMAERNGYPVLASIGHPTPGSLGNWAGVDRGLPVITLELPEGRPLAECWQQNRQALLEAIAAEGQTPVSPAQPSR
jgi:protein MpaA